MLARSMMNDFERAEDAKDEAFIAWLRERYPVDHEGRLDISPAELTRLRKEFDAAHAVDAPQ